MSVKHELNQDSENQVKTKCKPSENQVKIVNQVQPIASTN